MHLLILPASLACPCLGCCAQGAPGQGGRASPGSPGGLPGVIGRKLPGLELGGAGEAMGGLLAAGSMPFGLAPVDHALNLALLDSAFANVPQPRDSERPKTYTPVSGIR